MLKGGNGLIITESLLALISSLWSSFEQRIKMNKIFLLAVIISFINSVIAKEDTIFIQCDVVNYKTHSLSLFEVNFEKKEIILQDPQPYLYSQKRWFDLKVSKENFEGWILDFDLTINKKTFEVTSYISKKNFELYELDKNGFELKENELGTYIKPYENCKQVNFD